MCQNEDLFPLICFHSLFGHAETLFTAHRTRFARFCRCTSRSCGLLVLPDRYDPCGHRTQLRRPPGRLGIFLERHQGGRRKNHERREFHLDSSHLHEPPEMGLAAARRGKRLADGHGARAGHHRREGQRAPALPHHLRRLQLSSGTHGGLYGGRPLAAREFRLPRGRGLPRRDHDEGRLHVGSGAAPASARQGGNRHGFLLRHLDSLHERLLFLLDHHARRREGPQNAAFAREPVGEDPQTSLRQLGVAVHRQRRKVFAESRGKRHGLECRPQALFRPQLADGPQVFARLA